MPKLLLKFNAAVIKEVAMDKESIAIGRKPDNDIVIDNPAISGHHCKLTLEGGGYSEIGGKRYDWVQGDAVHVPPGMMHHQHFNPYDKDMKELRFEFGVRYWLVDQWKGYTTVDKHLKATTHMTD